jgi:hypothetical protein
MTISTELTSTLAGVLSSAALGVFGWTAVTLTRLVQRVEDLPCVKDAVADCPANPKHKRRMMTFGLLMFVGMIGFDFYIYLLVNQ